jgi:hypothetical protein
MVDLRYDAEYAGDRHTYRSTGAYIGFFAVGPATWKSVTGNIRFILSYLLDSNVEWLAAPTAKSTGGGRTSLFWQLERLGPHDPLFRVVSSLTSANPITIYLYLRGGLLLATTRCCYYTLGAHMPTFQELRIILACICRNTGLAGSQINPCANISGSSRSSNSNHSVGNSTVRSG